jgi:hypothetical protein
MKARKLTKQEESQLTERQAALYKEALRLLRKKINWDDFYGFVFRDRSPVFEGLALQSDAIGTPLYTSLQQMWLQLGVEQGGVRDAEPDRPPRRSRRAPRST